MRIQLTVTAHATRDPSCNLLSMTQVMTYPLRRHPTPEVVKEECQKLTRAFKEAWPHNQNVPTLIPIDIDIRKVAA